MQDFERIQKLIGDVGEDDMEFVTSYTSENFGIFIPVVGFRGFHTKSGHSYPSYLFIILPEENQNLFKTSLNADSDQYIAGILPPGTAHEEKIKNNYVRYIAIFVSENLLKEVIDTKSLHKSEKWESFVISKDIMYMVNRYIDESKDPKKEESLAALSSLIAADLARAFVTGNPATTFSAGGEIKSSAAYIKENYHEPLRIGDLAHRVGMSVADFAETFKKEIGSSPKSYIIQTRLDKARELIRENEKTLTEIALSCGFNSVTHMDSSHKKYYGMTPSAYKRSHGSFR